MYLLIAPHAAVVGFIRLLAELPHPSTLGDERNKSRIPVWSSMPTSK